MSNHTDVAIKTLRRALELESVAKTDQEVEFVKYVKDKAKLHDPRVMDQFR